MKCYYCKKDCEGLVFEQENLSVFAHRKCATQKVEKDGFLKGTLNEVGGELNDNCK